MKYAAHTIAALSLFAASLVGCVQMHEDPPVEEVIPTAEEVQIRLPDDAPQQYALGAISESYMFTRRMTLGFNGGAAFVLGLVHTVVQYPPTTIDDNVYTWGPHTRPLAPAEWRLIVTELDDGSYDWQLDGKSKTIDDPEWMTVISGNAIPGVEPKRGSGHFFMDFDAAEAVNPVDNDAVGNVLVNYDLSGTDGLLASLTMHIESEQEGPSGGVEPVSADYAYAEEQDGAGDFQFTIHADLDDNASAFEDGMVRSRWLPTGEGRADWRFSGGDLPEAMVVDASECWDGQYRQTYYADSENFKETEGDVADCAFAEAELPAL